MTSRLGTGNSRTFFLRWTWRSRGKGEEAGKAEIAADWRIVDYSPRIRNMVATRNQGHVQFATGDSKSGKYSTLWVFSAREAVGGKFSGRTTVYQFNVSVHEYYYAVCT